MLCTRPKGVTPRPKATVIDFAPRHPIGEGGMYFSNDMRSFEHGLCDTRSARDGLSHRHQSTRAKGASPALHHPPDSPSRRSAAFFDISEPVRLWIEGIAGLVLLFAGFASVLVLIHGAAQ